jgi:hypothetical protein
MERYGQELMPIPTEVSSFMFFERRFFGGKLRQAATLSRH